MITSAKTREISKVVADITFQRPRVVTRGRLCNIQLIVSLLKYVFYNLNTLCFFLNIQFTYDMIMTKQFIMVLYFLKFLLFYLFFFFFRNNNYCAAFRWILAYKLKKYFRFLFCFQVFNCIFPTFVSDHIDSFGHSMKLM